jgi:MFS family permease
VPLVLLSFATACGAYLATVVSSVQEAMRADLGYDDNAMAMLQGIALAWPIVVAMAPLGNAIDRLSRKTLLIAFLLLGFASILITASLSNFWLLFLSRSLAGLSLIAIANIAFSLLADLYPPHQRGRAKALLIFGQFGGMAACFALGGRLVDIFAGQPDPWRPVLAVMSVPVLMVAGLSALLREPPRTKYADPKRSMIAAMALLLRNLRPVLPLMSGYVMINFAVNSAMIWTVPSFLRQFATSASEVGALVALATLGGGLAAPALGGLLADHAYKRGGKTRTARILCIVSMLAVPAAAYSLVPTLAGAAAVLALYLLLAGAALAASAALFTIVIPEDGRGVFLMALACLSAIIVQGLGPLAVSALATALGGGDRIGLALAGICACGCAVAAAGFALAARSSRRASEG